MVFASRQKTAWISQHKSSGEAESANRFMGTIMRARNPLPLLWLGLVALLLATTSALAQRTATATATVINGFVVGITVTDPGEGYINPPSVSIVGGGGSGAAATATLTGSGVGSITVTAAGSGYVSLPDVVVGPPDVVAPSLMDLAIDAQTTTNIPRLTIYGELGAASQIQGASVLGDTNTWVMLTNLLLPSSPYVFYDSSSPSGPHRYYRVSTSGLGARPPTPAGFVHLPPGRFMMGSPSTEQTRNADEGPQTVVTLSQGFFMKAHEVTQGDYAAVVGSNPSYFTGDLNRPVEEVTWVDAVSYCAKLTEKERSAGRLPTGWTYRLPTEAEWEYAARAGTTTRYSFGDDPTYTILRDYAWFASNSGSKSHSVAGKRPNQWGLYDMNGNLWEWCSDWYGPYNGGRVTDPKGAPSGTNHVLRGGGWYSDRCRSAQRGMNVPTARNNGFGFRVVLAPVR